MFRKVYHQLFSLFSEFIQAFAERVVEDMQIERHKRKEATLALSKNLVVDTILNYLVHAGTIRHQADQLLQ